MDNNNPPSIDPSLMAPQGVAPMAPVSDHLIDITPGAAAITSPSVAPINSVQEAPLPESKVIDITPTEPTPAPVTPIQTPVVPVSNPVPSVPEPVTPIAPVTPVTPVTPINPLPVTPPSPLAEDPNLVQTIG